MKLCKHVEYARDEDGLHVTKGAAIPIFGWSRELNADTPRLKCSRCGETEVIGATVVFVNRGAWNDRKAVDPAEDDNLDWDELEEDVAWD